MTAVRGTGGGGGGVADADALSDGERGESFDQGSSRASIRI